MLKHKLNCIFNKNLFYCAPKPNTKKKLDFNVKMQTMLTKKMYKYGNIPPMNEFRIVILGYCIHFFGLIALIWLRCLILNTPCKFQKLCIGNFAYLNFVNKVLVLFKARPCILWNEPHLSCRNTNDAQQVHAG
jgi:hypothetical protein